MFSRNGCYTKTENVVLRRFEEWGRCYAFTPDEPEVYDLNTSAWFILELCDGRPFQQIEADYVATLGPRVGRDKAKAQFHAGFDELLSRNIISAIE
ncbi:MAG TPA: PqqD family protein [Hyphomicrobiaceae bacterium]